MLRCHAVGNIVINLAITGSGNILATGVFPSEFPWKTFKSIVYKYNLAMSGMVQI